MGSLEALVGHQCEVVTCDGRVIVGVMRGFDSNALNIILDGCHERVFSSTQGVEMVVLGLYVIRGDNIAAVGQLDTELDSRIDMRRIKALPLKPVVH